LVLSSLGTSNAETSPPLEPGWNVILITWDSVRRQEFSGYPDPAIEGADGLPTLPYFWGEAVGRGRLYGDPRGGPPMLIANAAVLSLPAYHSMMSGRAGFCLSNDCGRVRRQTFLERALDHFRLVRTKVASIASWARLALAVEKDAGKVFVNAGPEPLDDGGHDPERDRLNELQEAEPSPWEEVRSDRFTQAQALHYIKKHQPHFLHIGFNDLDEWGHLADYPMYLETLRAYDRYLRDTIATLAELGNYGAKTCVLVTTDHGRGRGKKWSEHGINQPNAAAVFLYASCPLAPEPSPFDVSTRLTSHADIRPTIEHMLGLSPMPCLFCGRSLFRSPSSGGGSVQSAL